MSSLFGFESAVSLLGRGAKGKRGCFFKIGTFWGLGYFRWYLVVIAVKIAINSPIDLSI